MVKEIACEKGEKSIFSLPLNMGVLLILGGTSYFVKLLGRACFSSGHTYWVQHYYPYLFPYQENNYGFSVCHVTNLDFVTL